MSSERLPGKVLMPFRGEPIIRHVLRRIHAASPPDSVVVLTSTDPTDDPLAAYIDSLGVTVFRGSLHNVFERFRHCAEMHPCEWILRLSADSPLLDPNVLALVLGHAGDSALDLVTTTFPRTFPTGQNAELIRVKTFMSVDATELTHHDREHVTAYFYRTAERYRIKNIVSADPELAQTGLAIDTLDDLRRLRALPIVPEPAEIGS